ncbi:MAG TPA: Panacea domain-containing protein [Dehalococcoidia bacterium]|nr:Panacea domain-containing protein [Dehalococcoidia bacterium]
MATSKIAFDFNEPKAIETILYLANRISHSFKYKICKMVYLADKTSLEKYGRLIFGESYSAMKEGATPSKSYDLLKQIAEECTNDLRVKGNSVVALRDANLDYLSESDIECLDQTIAIYNKNPQKMYDDAHDDAWERAWESRGEKRSADISVRSIAKTLTNSKDLIDYLTNRSVE